MQTVIHLSISLDVGGLENLILNLCQRIDRQQYRPVVCCLSDGLGLRSEFEEIGVPVYSVPKRPGIDWQVIPPLAAILRMEKVDILHTHNTAPYLYGTIAGKWAGVGAMVHTEHSNIEREHQGLWYAQRYLSYLSSPIIADSQSVADTLIQEQGVCPRRVVVILNGIDVERFRPRPPDPRLQAEFGFETGEFVIGIVARLVPVKHHQLLLRAFAELCRQRTDTRLLIIGDGPSCSELTELASSLEIAERVVFTGNRRDIPECLSLMDLFVLSSLSEGLPLTILEAMAAGVPLISTQVGGIPEVIQNGVNGLLVPSGDTVALRNACQRLLEQPLQRQALAQHARADVVNRYSLAAMTRGYETIYRRVRGDCASRPCGLVTLR